ncbi:hypothetical protein [Schlesneria paludicola]|uniref:hypothetical protein n=1 Tax=Schlesneria paludicola TaxID=360056 RepID=UPI0002F74DED|nr:hypothetical protein [Schlesneria paludicola]
MTTKTDAPQTVTEVFDHDDVAVAAVRELKQAGFGESQIDIAFLEMRFDPQVRQVPSEMGEMAIVGTAAGIGIGGLWGLATLAEIAPGIGPAILEGPASVILCGMAVGAATWGTIGAIVGMFIPRDALVTHPSPSTASHAIVTVQAGDRVGLASSVLNRFSHIDHGMPQAS